jgi:hypothetical protein
MWEAMDNFLTAMKSDLAFFERQIERLEHGKFRIFDTTSPVHADVTAEYLQDLKDRHKATLEWIKIRQLELNQSKNV